MRSGLVAVVLASRPETADSQLLCVNCQALLQGAKLFPHLCGACGFPQPLREAENSFSLLGVRPLFGQDESFLRARFYELSRALHPDRFAAADPRARHNSIERMSRINEAYRSLRDRKLLRETLLSLYEVGESVTALGNSARAQKGAPPVELAESWFELQDAVMDDPNTAQTKILEFEKSLQFKRHAFDVLMTEQEALFDVSEGQDRVALLEISRILREVSYLDSLFRDVLRLKERLGVSPFLGSG